MFLRQGWLTSVHRNWKLRSGGNVTTTWKLSKASWSNHCYGVAAWPAFCLPQTLSHLAHRPGLQQSGLNCRLRYLATQATEGDQPSSPPKDPIAYEDYWTDERIAELQRIRPDLLVQGTLLIPAFSTNDARIVASSSLASTQHTHQEKSQEKSTSSPINSEISLFGFLARNRSFNGDEVIGLRLRRHKLASQNWKDKVPSSECRIIAILKRNPQLHHFIVLVDPLSLSKGNHFKCQPRDTRWPASRCHLDQIHPDLKERLRGYKRGSKVFCYAKFIRWASNEIEPTCELTQLIGDVANPEAQMEAIMWFNGLNPKGFSDELLQELKGLVNSGLDHRDLNRVDMTHLQVFSIDPKDAKDLDDALSVEVREEGGNVGYRVGIHIADVSHFVPAESLVDLDARERATSVYLEHKVYPMLPHVLSEDLCSLLPGAEKLCFSVFVDIGETTSVDGELGVMDTESGAEVHTTTPDSVPHDAVTQDTHTPTDTPACQSDHTESNHTESDNTPPNSVIGTNLVLLNEPQFLLTRIKSRMKMSYEACADIIKLSPISTSDLIGMPFQAFEEAIANICSQEDSSSNTTAILRLFYLSRKMRHFRLNGLGAVHIDVDGAIRCHIPRVDNRRRVAKRAVRLELEPVPELSHQLIEEMMILANVQVAKLFDRRLNTFFLRIHEDTDREVRKYLMSALPAELKRVVDVESGTSEILRRCAKLMPPNAFQSLCFGALQMFKEAAYAPVGGPVRNGVTASHWGLALPVYLHFTSPIRRYSDLYTHRMLKQFLLNNVVDNQMMVLREICERCNLQKRRAFDAQKEYKNYAFNQYLLWFCKGNPPLAASDPLFNRCEGSVWGFFYKEACISGFSLVGPVKEAEVKPSIKFYIPLLNEERSVSCDLLGLKVKDVEVGQGKWVAGEKQVEGSILDGYYVRERGGKDNKEDVQSVDEGTAQVYGIRAKRGKDDVVYKLYDTVSVVIVPGQQMWTVRLPSG